MPARELEQLITVRTAECDGMEAVGELLAGARTARILTAEPVPGTHITKATVDIGGGAPITVACGAPNCRAGLQTIWVPLGIKTIQGIESNGMLASAQELDLGRDHAGIIEWNEPVPSTYNPTWSSRSITSPSRTGPISGVTSAWRAKWRRSPRSSCSDPVDLGLLPAHGEAFTVSIEDFDLCPRFSAVTFENVAVAPSPLWLQYRLTSVGLNPINNIVDITNYVMAELAQPMHAFDRDKLRGDRLMVRPARDGETLPRSTAKAIR